MIVSISEGFGALLNFALGASAKFASVYSSLLDEGGRPGSVLSTEGKTLLLVPHLCKGEDRYATRSPRFKILPGTTRTHLGGVGPRTTRRRKCHGKTLFPDFRTSSLFGTLLLIELQTLFAFHQCFLSVLGFRLGCHTTFNCHVFSVSLVFDSFLVFPFFL